MPVWAFLTSMLVALMWAVSPVLMKRGMMYCTPNDVPAVRSISFFLVMALIMLITQPGKMPFMTFKLFAALVGSVLLSSLIGDLLYIYAVQKIGASLAVTVSCGYPLISVVVSVALLHEQVGLLVWCGTILIIAGIVVIKLDSSRQERMKMGYRLVDFDEQIKQRANMTGGIVMALGSAVCSGINIPLLKLLMEEGGWNPTESYFLRAAVFFFMVWMLREAQRRFSPNSISPIEKMPFMAWIAILSSGIVGIALSGILFAVCIQNFPVSVISPITASSPFMTVLLSRIFLKEKLSGVQSAGVVLVIAGSVSVSL
jgi:drug/metabolite transporter (DMT)-like permease